MKRLPQTLVFITKITGSPLIIPGNKTELYTQKYKNNSIKVFRSRNTQTRTTQPTHRTPFINHFPGYKNLKRLPQTLVFITKITGSPLIIPGNKTELYTQKYKNNSIKVFRSRNTQTRTTQPTHRTPFINHFPGYKNLKRLPQTLVVITKITGSPLIIPGTKPNYIHRNTKITP